MAEEIINGFATLRSVVINKNRHHSINHLDYAVIRLPTEVRVAEI